MYRKSFKEYCQTTSVLIWSALNEQPYKFLPAWAITSLLGACPGCIHKQLAKIKFAFFSKISCAGIVHPALLDILVFSPCSNYGATVCCKEINKYFAVVARIRKKSQCAWLPDMQRSKRAVIFTLRLDFLTCTDVSFTIPTATRQIATLNCPPGAVYFGTNTTSGAKIAKTVYSCSQMKKLYTFLNLLFLWSV